MSEELQWGRGFSTAESTTTALPWRPICSGFNGAAVFQPRKGGAAEGVEPALPGFNGAAVFQPRKVLNERSPQGGVVGFNGAAVFQPRKGRFQQLDATHKSWLQWGRGFSTAERRCPVALGLLFHPGFNGAAVFQPRKG